MKKQTIFITIILFSVISAFQNCGPTPVSFSTGEGLTKVAVNDSQSNVEESQVSEAEADEDAGKDSKEADVVKIEDEERDDEEADKDDEQNKDADVVYDDNIDKAYYICILNGPGKSVALGYNAGKLVEQNSTPKVVCMTESACKNLVSAKFDVKGAERRGYCPQKNKHVVPLSDKALKDLLK